MQKVTVVRADLAQHRPIDYSYIEVCMVSSRTLLMSLSMNEPRIHLQYVIS